VSRDRMEKKEGRKGEGIVEGASEPRLDAV
jgi:hypothetical protein